MRLEIDHHLHLPTGVLSVAVSSDGSLLYASCVDGKVYEVSTATKAIRPFLQAHDSYASGCVLLPDKQTLISAGYDGQLIWHDVRSLECQRKVKAHDFWSWQIALSPDGKWLASTSGQYLAGGEKYEPAGSDQPTVVVLDAVSGEVKARLHHGPPVLSCAFSPNGKHLAAANMMGDIAIWDIDTAKEIARWNTPDFTSWGIIKSPHYLGGIYGLAFSPDGKQLTACGMGPMLDPMAGNGKMTWQRWNWQASPPQKIDQIRDGQHGSGLMEAIHWQNDGSHFVMAGRQAQGTWNAALFAADGTLAASLDTKSRITRAIFSPDGKKLWLAAATGQPNPKEKQADWGRIHVVNLMS